jgi:hypothetical protein
MRPETEFKLAPTARIHNPGRNMDTSQNGTGLRIAPKVKGLARRRPLKLGLADNMLADNVDHVI